MSDWFVSDLHLGPHRPALTQAFARFARTVAGDAGRLYILGDLFDAWIGDDCVTELGETVAQSLAAANRAGTALYFLPGNRDFLLGSDYAERAGLRLIEDGEGVELSDGRRAVVLHGDHLCTDDVAYQEFRSQVRSRAWQAEFLSKPLRERLDYAEYARRESRAATDAKSTDIMDVNEAAVRRYVERAGEINVLIHGHTHRPGSVPVALPNGRQIPRIVLGDWHNSATAVRHDGSGFTRCTWSLASS